jgi:hypothetical protein
LEAAPDAELLQRLGRPSNDAHALVEQAVRERAERPARRAVRAVLAQNGHEGADLLVESLASADRERRASAVELLEARGGDIVRPLLAIWDERIAAAPASGELERLASSDPDDMVREAARRAITGGKEMETLSTISLMDRVLFLRKVSLFAGLAPSELKQVALLAREDLHADGVVLMREGEFGDRMFVILSGRARIIMKGGRELTRGVGEAIGEMAVVSDQPRSATVVSDGEVRTLTIGRRDFDAILRDRPQVAQAIIRVLCARLAEMSSAA